MGVKRAEIGGEGQEKGEGGELKFQLCLSDTKGSALSRIFCLSLFSLLLSLLVFSSLSRKLELLRFAKPGLRDWAFGPKRPKFTVMVESLASLTECDCC